MDSVTGATPQPRLVTVVTIKCAGRATSVFLIVDTGADISTVPESKVALLMASTHVQPTSTDTSNFDGSAISTSSVAQLLAATVVHIETRKQAPESSRARQLTSCYRTRFFISGAFTSVTSADLQVANAVASTTPQVLHKNNMADAPSRLPRPSGTPAVIDDTPVELQAVIAALKGGTISLERIRQHTDEDPILSRVKRYIRTRWPKKTVWTQNSCRIIIYVMNFL